MKNESEQLQIELEIAYKKLANAESSFNTGSKKYKEDIELKHYRIQELENELNKRERELMENIKIQQNYEDDKRKLYNEGKRLEAELETLKGDYEVMENEISELKSDNENMKIELKNSYKTVENLKDKENLLNFYKEKSTKCDEIVKLQELNLFVLIIINIRILKRNVKL